MPAASAVSRDCPSAESARSTDWTASQHGTIPKLSLFDDKGVQPEGSTWDIRVDQGVVIGGKRTSRRLYDAWPRRPANWRRWHFSPLIAKDLDPERIDDPLPFP